MKRKGFTIIEVLAVIAILGIILAISVPQVLKTVERNKVRALGILIDNIKSAAEGYISDDDDAMDELEEQMYVEISLEDLVTGGYLKGAVKNPKTGKEITNLDEIPIVINYNENKTFDIDVGYGREGVLFFPKVVYAERADTGEITLNSTDGDVKILCYDEAGLKNCSDNLKIKINENEENAVSLTSYGEYDVDYILNEGQDNELKFERKIYVYEDLGKVIFGDDFNTEETVVIGNETYNYVYITEIDEGNDNDVEYVVMKHDKQGIKLLRKDTWGEELCWSGTYLDDFCQDADVKYTESQVYKDLNNEYLKTIKDRKKLVNYKWQIGQVDYDGDSFEEVSKVRNGIKLGKAGLINLEELFNIEDTEGINKYIYLLDKNYFSLTVSGVKIDGEAALVPCIVLSNGKVGPSELSNGYIRPVIVIPRDTKIIGGNGAVGDAYKLLF